VRYADKLLERAALLATTPEFAAALDDARISVGHIDALAHVLRSLEPDERQGLLDQVPRLATIASRATPSEFHRTLRREANRLRADNGMPRLDRQRRDTRVKTWIDTGTGMWCLSGRFDPETGLTLTNRLDTALHDLFAEHTPPTCPTDAGARNDHLRPLALVSLTGPRVDRQASSGGCGSARAEIVVVVDTTAPDRHGQPVIDWGLPVELPPHVLLDLYDTADVQAVVVRNGIVLHAPGRLDLGRSTRIANRAQRRALRALYPTCAIPGCEIRYDLCTIHDVLWWRNAGTTDLHNLLPLCTRHHHNVHDDHWTVSLDRHRQLTITLPDGRTLSTGPPRRGS
jgi:Domain of unknown function (DUF222)